MRNMANFSYWGVCSVILCLYSTYVPLTVVLLQLLSMMVFVGKFIFVFFYNGEHGWHRPWLKSMIHSAHGQKAG